MNGFEPLRRRVIDYTAAGQWQEVYDGPIEECEEYRLADENGKLRELVRDMYEMAYPEYPSAFDAAFADRMRELGVEVDG